MIQSPLALWALARSAVDHGWSITIARAGARDGRWQLRAVRSVDSGVATVKVRWDVKGKLVDAGWSLDNATWHPVDLADIRIVITEPDARWQP